MLSPVSMIALFNCFNLTFMAQNVKSHYDGFSQGLKLGDDVPRFSAQAISGLPITTRSNHGRMIINFISSGCPHCKEQLQLLSTLASQLASSPYQFVNVSADLQPELLRYLPFAEWVEDSEGRLRKLFKVSGYPTLFVIESNGKISQVIPGVPEELKDHLESLISNSAR
jgi:peroxiredoxin